MKNQRALFSRARRHRRRRRGFKRCLSSRPCIIESTRFGHWLHAAAATRCSPLKSEITRCDLPRCGFGRRSGCKRVLRLEYHAVETLTKFGSGVRNSLAALAQPETVLFHTQSRLILTKEFFRRLAVATFKLRRVSISITACD